MNFSEFLVALRRRWRIIAIVAAATMAVAWITTPGAPKKKAERRFDGTQELVTVTGNAKAGQWDRWTFDATNGPVPKQIANDFDGSVVPVTGGQKSTRGGRQNATLSISGEQVRIAATPDSNIGKLTIVVNASTRELAGAVSNDLAARLITALQSNADRLVDDQKKALEAKATEYDRLIEEWTQRKIACLDTLCLREANTKIATYRIASRQNNAEYLAKLRAAKKQIDLRANYVDSEGKPQAFVKPAPVTTTSKIPKTAKPRILGGMLIGLLLGAIVAFLVSRFDSAVYGIPSTEAAARLPVLAEIPHVTTTRRRRFEVLTQLSPLSGVADAYRGLRTSIGLMWLANESETGQNEPRTLLVASPGPNEGKSTSSANLAAAYAEIGKKVIVVDLDFRRQRLHRFLGANAEPYLENKGSLSDPIIDLDAVLQNTSIPGVQFIGSSTPDSTPAEAAVAGRAAILAARERADIVIIDTPPLLLTNDTFDLLDLSDAVVLLARDAKTKTAALSRAGQQLRRLDAPVVGIALIGAISSRPGYGYGYGYGYRYGYSYGYGYGSRSGVTQAAAVRRVESAAERQNADEPVPAGVASDSAAGPSPDQKRGRFARRGRRLDEATDSGDVDQDD